MSNELRNVIINAVRLSDEQVRALEQMYRVRASSEGWRVQWETAPPRQKPDAL